MNIIGITMYDLKKYEESIKCFETTISLDPNNPIAYNGKGNSLFNMVKFKLKYCVFTKSQLFYSNRKST